MNYKEFIARKLQHGAESGFSPIWIPSYLMDFQSSVAEYSIRAGRSAALIDCGMGKSIISLVWAENVIRYTNRSVLILAPLAVADQFVREGEKFGIEVTRSKDGKWPAGKRLIVANYERLHYFAPADFAGVVCDEASCIKAFKGVRRAQVTEFLRTIPYRLMATATAAPNDYIELGTLSEALGIMGQQDMLTRFFRNDDGNSTAARRPGRFQMRESREKGVPGWRFKGHAETPFWRWICSWARAGRRPSDLGPFSDERFKLPELTEKVHIVKSATLAPGLLFEVEASNRSEELEERRRTLPERCQKAAELTGDGLPYIVWCHLNPEGELLEKLCPDAVHISGSDSDDEKEEKYAAFLSGQSRGMISKQKIGGWGLNCQHCPHVIEFADHSYEAHYQGVRRCWRYGQTRPVVNDIIATEGQRRALESMQRKAVQADRMFTGLMAHMNQAMTIDAGYRFEKEVEVPEWLVA